MLRCRVLFPLSAFVAAVFSMNLIVAVAVPTCQRSRPGPFEACGAPGWDCNICADQCPYLGRSCVQPALRKIPEQLQLSCLESSVPSLCDWSDSLAPCYELRACELGETDDGNCGIWTDCVRTLHTCRIEYHREMTYRYCVEE